MMVNLPPKDQFSRAVCLFLSEALRTHKTSLKRAAEIAQQVLDHLNLIDSEKDFLSLIKNLEKDFQELTSLEQMVLRKMQSKERDDMEERVREFVISALSSNPKICLDVLEAAVREDSSLQILAERFPAFSQFINQTYEPQRN